MNWLLLEASIVERESLRYTPAGVPIVGCTLSHRSEVTEAGVLRKIELTLSAVVVGELSDWLARCKLGCSARFVGFLAPRSRKARVLVFHILHITELEPVYEH